MFSKQLLKLFLDNRAATLFTVVIPMLAITFSLYFNRLSN